MKLIKTRDYEELSRRAAAIIASHIILKPDCVLGLATGSSPLGAYRCLADMHKKSGLDFSQVTTVNLDEYKGLPGSHEQSYRYFMDKNLFNLINIDRSHTHIPDGTEPDPEKACAAYDAVLKKTGPADLQLLGLGHNGHIGFNEPADYFPDGTHCVNLAESTIRANTRFFSDESQVPRQAYTMGIGAILRARSALVLVSGRNKAEILKKILQEPVTPRIPGSILKFHPDCTVIADEAALSEL